MRSFAKLALVGLTVVAAQTPELSATGTGDMTGSASELAPAISLINKAITETSSASAKEAKLCKEEQDATILWDQTVNTPESRAEAKGNRDARAAAKKELAAALANRLKVLQDFLQKLYASRQRLGGHIHRVNDIFQTVYGANTQTQVNAAETIKLLGISVSQPYSPMFAPIKLPKQDEEEAAAAGESAVVTTSEDGATGAQDTESASEVEAASDEQKDAVLADSSQVSADAPADEKDTQLSTATDLASKDEFAPESMLMELESRMNQKVKGCVGKDCNRAYTAAFELYKKTYVVNKANVEHFENERKALGGFRDGLKALIKKKEDKMALLAAQLKELEASLANPGPTLEQLFDMIKKHYDTNKASCSLMAGRSKMMLKLLSDPSSSDAFLELLKAGKVDCQGENAPVVVSESEAATAVVEVVEPAAPIAPTPEVPDLKPAEPIEHIEVPEVVTEGVDAAAIPSPPTDGGATEIVNIDSTEDPNEKGDEIFESQV